MMDVQRITDDHRKLSEHTPAADDVMSAAGGSRFVYGLLVINEYPDVPLSALEFLLFNSSI